MQDGKQVIVSKIHFPQLQEIIFHTLDNLLTDKAL